MPVSEVDKVKEQKQALADANARAEASEVRARELGGYQKEVVELREGNVSLKKKVADLEASNAELVKQAASAGAAQKSAEEQSARAEEKAAAAKQLSAALKVLAG